MNILEPNLLILASAGSGKTHQLGNRVIGLVASGVPPEKIVALTFTRKAAGEFAESILTRLANAASDEKFAARLRADLAMPNADFSASLESIIRALPKLTLGTIDSFFASVVRGFQYELGLTGGKFDLLEGQRAAAEADEILTAILSETLETGDSDDFLHAFRRATIGQEGQAVASNLRKFVEKWQSRYRATRGLEWGPSCLAKEALDTWEKQKHELTAKILRGLDGVTYTRKGQREALEKAIKLLCTHRIGSGSLGAASSLLASILAAVSEENSPLVFKFYKEFTVDGPAGDALRAMVNLAAQCEMTAALQRTKAVGEVVAIYDQQCEKKLRRRGLLSFDDVKILMAEWTTGEDARLRREAIDFRLDARYEHWLLDEFQDTSRSDWTGLLPLIDEAASDQVGSIFIVGDKKQAIYGWRGGEVKLFDEAIEKWQLQPQKMAQSWRSSPAVLELVNRVCGDAATMRELFGEAAAKWDWQEHVSAEPLTRPDQCGEARVEIVAGKWEDRLERLGELLDELGVARLDLTCGVLVRNNKQVSEVADHLRAKGFEVIEEGRRKPAMDNPIGIALLHLLKWLANPADTFAREVIEMSPFAAALQSRFGNDWQMIWDGLLTGISEDGFAKMITRIIEDCSRNWSDFGRRRAGDIVTALAGLDARGGVTAQAAADWIERLEVSQSPGVAAVQVMTIHKSKGLGFDVVILPEIPNDKIPEANYFEVAASNEWITQTPPKWARSLIPEMRAAEIKWAESQAYEGFCMLYVALTRAKRGLYAFIKQPAKDQDENKPSLANWLIRSTGSDAQPGVIYQSGSPNWLDHISPIVSEKIAPTTHSLGMAVPRRERVTPSGAKKNWVAASGDSTRGIASGNEVHAAFETVGWVDEISPKLPMTDAGRVVAEILKIKKMAELFERRGRAVELFREQPVDAIDDGKWLSGVVDRLHLHRDDRGLVTRVEIIDFKTDSVDHVDQLAMKYSQQMNTYRGVLERAYPDAKVECLLLSTRWLDFTYL